MKLADIALSEVNSAIARLGSQIEGVENLRRSREQELRAQINRLHSEILRNSTHDILDHLVAERQRLEAAREQILEAANVENLERAGIQELVEKFDELTTTVQTLDDELDSMRTSARGIREDFDSAVDGALDTLKEHETELDSRSSEADTVRRTIDQLRKSAKALLDGSRF